MTHAEKILSFLELNPGSTYGEVTAATGIGSPHRRITGKETPKGWRLRTEKCGKLYVHFADRLDGADGVGFQVASATVPATSAKNRMTDPFEPARDVPIPDPALSVEPDDLALEAEARATCDRLGYTPSAMQDAR